MNLSNLNVIAPSKKTIFFLKTLYIIFYIVFIALCVLTGILLFNYLFSLFVNPFAAGSINAELNLTHVLTQQPNLYHLLMWNLILIAAAKALLFYYIIKIPYSLDVSRPFTDEFSKRVFSTSYTALGIGILLILGQLINELLVTKGITVVKIEGYIGGSEEFLMTAGILYFIASIFNKGVEIQRENDLTV